MHSCQIFMKKYLHEGKNTPKNEVNVTLNKKSISEHHNHDRAALHGPQSASERGLRRHNSFCCFSLVCVSSP